MMGARWTFRRSAELERALEELDPVMRHKVEKDIEKVVTRGIERVSEPLVAHLDGAIYYVRSMVAGRGWFRAFYYRDGPASLFGFFGYFKKSAKLPGRIRKQVLRKYGEYREEERR